MFLNYICSYDDAERLIERFLEGARFKFKEAYESMMAHHKFVQGFPIQMSQFNAWKDELNKGYAYVYRRDRAYRPLFIMNVNKLKKVKADHDTLINMSTYMI